MLAVVFLYSRLGEETTKSTSFLVQRLSWHSLVGVVFMAADLEPLHERGVHGRAGAPFVAVYGFFYGIRGLRGARERTLLVLCSTVVEVFFLKCWTFKYIVIL